MSNAFKIGDRVRDKVTKQTATVISLSWTTPWVPGVNSNTDSDPNKYQRTQADLVEVRFDVLLGGGKIAQEKYSVGVNSQSLELIPQ